MSMFCSEADDAVCFGKESEKLEAKALNLRVITHSYRLLR